MVLVAAAGTSDLPVAEEAAVTAEVMGNAVDRLYDVGVAGLHRLLREHDRLRRARVIIVVAGMEGALPSVVAGLVQVPVIAVPTSVGYGASFGGLAALLGMLNSCANGVSVVNIDNGFGAGCIASLINHLPPLLSTPLRTRSDGRGIDPGRGQVARLAGSLCRSWAASARVLPSSLPHDPNVRVTHPAMNPGALRALEFDRIVDAVRSFALTPTGASALGGAAAGHRRAPRPGGAAGDDRDGALPRRISPLFPLRAPDDLEELLALLGVVGPGARTCAAARARDVPRVDRDAPRRRCAGRAGTTRG